LLREPSTPAGTLEGHLKARSSAGGLKLSERVALEEAIKLERLKETSYTHQAKLVLFSPFAPKETAFFFPQRFFAAFLISFFGVVFMGIGIVRWCDAYRQSIQKLDNRSVLAMYTMLTSLQTQFYSLTGADLDALETGWIFDNANQLHHHMLSLAESLYKGIITGLAFGYLLFFGAWFTQMAEFRIQVLQARRGVWQFNWRQHQTVLVVTFIGTAVSNAMLVMILSCCIFVPICIILSWSVIQEYIAYVFGSAVLIIILFAVPFLQICIKYLARRLLFKDRHTLKYRYLFMFYDMYELIMTCVAGIMRNVVRMITVGFIALLSLPRIDRSPFPQWVEYYLLLDTGSKSFQGMVKLYHWHNHPVLRVAAWIMQEDAARRRTDPSKHGLVTSKKRIFANRWWKIWMMLKHPVLATYSSRGEEKPEILATKGEDKAAVVVASLETKKGATKRTAASRFGVRKGFSPAEKAAAKELDAVNMA